YARCNITDFWRHWHISLYKWLVDYVFIPLGGSRGSTAFVCRNVMLVMLVSGIWHGAGLNFVVWGAWHGTLLVIHRSWTVARGETDAASPPSWRRRLSGWFLTYVTVNLGWAFFAMDLETALFFFRRLLIG